MLETLDLKNPETAHRYMAAIQVIHNLPQFGWYDSHFLAKFEAAKRFLTIVNPSETARFCKAFDILRTKPNFELRHLKNVLDANKVSEILNVIYNVPETDFRYGEKESFGRNVFHDLPILSALQEEFIPLISELTGELVEPDYTFLSLYNDGGVCLPHMDATSAKWTLDICLNQNCEWPIYFSPIVPWPEANDHTRQIDKRNLTTLDTTFTPYTLKANEALLFSGSSQWHYRDKIPSGGYCHLAFLHYRPAGTGNLVNPKVWAEHFNLPELALLNSAFDKIRPTSTA